MEEVRVGLQYMYYYLYSWVHIRYQRVKMAEQNDQTYIVTDNLTKGQNLYRIFKRIVPLIFSILFNTGKY